MSGAAPHPSRGFELAAVLLDELVRSGLRHVCVCPGSRSALLAAAASEQPGLRCWPHSDERSAGFFALGLAKALGEPVALVCTSGTAAANFLPAVVEAHYAGVPLLVLTADRPPELREWGAGQTIDQTHLYGRHVRWFAEPAAPGDAPVDPAHTRALAARAIAVARGPSPGPVHMNLPFREPLEPPADSRVRAAARAAGARESGSGRAYTDVRAPLPRPESADADRLAALARTHPRGVIAAGPMDASPDVARAVARLARAAGWPVLADPTSQLRCGPHTGGAPVLAHGDTLLRDAEFADTHAPEVVLLLGGTPTSKSFRLWTERHAPAHVVRVATDGSWNDPSHLASSVLRVDPGALCDAAAEALEADADASHPSDGDGDGDWLGDWLAAEAASERAIAAGLDAEQALLEPRVVRELAAVLPDDALLYVSNSMPVRDLDSFLPTSRRPLRVLCNRGANGIDGMVSSALGAAAANTAPVVLLTGDLAFLHDMGGLAAARRFGLRALIVVLDNDGGGIFSFLKIAESGESVGFEELFRTPHGLELPPLAAALGAAAIGISSWEHLRSAAKEALRSDRVTVLHVPVDRDRNVAHHRELLDSVRRALREALP